MGKYRITLEGKTYEMEVELLDGKNPPIEQKKERLKSEPKPNKAESISADQHIIGNKYVKSPMPGTILKVMVNIGNAVKKGQPVLVLEAMKMENEITSPATGKIKALFVQQGDTVQGGASLFEVE